MNNQRHVGYREDKTAQHKEGKDEEEGGHHGLLLRGGDGRYEQPNAQGAQKEKAGSSKQEGQTSLKWNGEPEYGEDSDHDHLSLGDHDIRNGLTED